MEILQQSVNSRNFDIKKNYQNIRISFIINTLYNINFKNLKLSLKKYGKENIFGVNFKIVNIEKDLYNYGLNIIIKKLSFENTIIKSENNQKIKELCVNLLSTHGLKSNHYSIDSDNIHFIVNIRGLRYSSHNKISIPSSTFLQKKSKFLDKNNYDQVVKNISNMTHEELYEAYIKIFKFF